MSVVVAPIAPGFQLESLGTPREAGQKLIDAVIAPEGSGKVATLLNASERSVLVMPMVILYVTQITTYLVVDCKVHCFS